MRCYLAHPVTDYGGSDRQRKAVAAIESRGWTVENPDKPWHQDGYKRAGMEYFTDLVGDCDALAFLRFPNGRIGAGVAKEIEAALRKGVPTYDLSTLKFQPITGMPMELMSVEETRAEIAAIRAPSEGAR